MSVLVETSLGAIVIDLHVREAPIASKNFLKLCKMKYYHGCLFYNVQPGFMVQAGDPSATGRGGTSVYGVLYGEQGRFFEDECDPQLKHNARGVVSMANMGEKDTNSSQFFITLRGEDNEHYNGKNTVFGRVEEGFEVLDQFNTEFIDEDGRPFRDIRILHTHVLDDPFPDPPELETLVPPASPDRERPPEERVPRRLAVGEDIEDLGASGQSAADVERKLLERETRSHAVVLEMLGDLPDADAAPPENVLFVCKLNPVTTDDDLETIFTRFGRCRADIVRDHRTSDSLNYAFVVFETVSACEEAYRKMDNVLVDDRRIKVDFSQSVSKQQWSAFSSGKAAKGAAAGGKAGGGGGSGETGRGSGNGGASGGPKGLAVNGAAREHGATAATAAAAAMAARLVAGAAGAAVAALPAGGSSRRSRWGNAAPAAPTAAMAAAPAADPNNGGRNRDRRDRPVNRDERGSPEESEERSRYRRRRRRTERQDKDGEGGRSESEEDRHGRQGDDEGRWHGRSRHDSDEDKRKHKLSRRDADRNRRDDGGRRHRRHSRSQSRDRSRSKERRRRHD